MKVFPFSPPIHFGVISVHFPLISFQLQRLVPLLCLDRPADQPEIMNCSGHNQSDYVIKSDVPKPDISADVPVVVHGREYSQTSEEMRSLPLGLLAAAAFYLGLVDPFLGLRVCTTSFTQCGSPLSFGPSCT